MMFCVEEVMRCGGFCSKSSWRKNLNKVKWRAEDVFFLSVTNVMPEDIIKKDCRDMAVC